MTTATTRPTFRPSPPARPLMPDAVLLPVHDLWLVTATTWEDQTPPRWTRTPVVALTPCRTDDGRTDLAPVVVGAGPARVLSMRHGWDHGDPDTLEHGAAFPAHHCDADPPEPGDPDPTFCRQCAGVIGAAA